MPVPPLVSLRRMVFAASSGAGPPPCRLPKALFLHNARLLAGTAGSPKVYLAAMKTAGDLGFGFFILW